MTFSDRNNPQDNWESLVQHFHKGRYWPEGDPVTDKDWDEAKEQARRYLASRLREAADAVEREKGCNPGVYGCSVPAPGESLVPDVMMTISVTLSYPWGG